MSLTNTTDSIIYVGNDSTDSFSIPFPFMLDTDIVAITVTDDVETTLVLNTDFEVEGAQVEAGGTLTLLSGVLPTGTSLYIGRVEPLTQLANIRNQNQYYASVHETVFDKLTMIAQQLQSEIDRAFKIPVTQSTSTLPTTYPNANTALIFDGTDYVWDVFPGGGDVIGPDTSTINAIPRWEDITGSELKDSGVLIDDSDNVTGVVNLTASGLITGGTGSFGSLSTLVVTGKISSGTADANAQFTINRNDLSGVTQYSNRSNMTGTSAGTTSLLGFSANLTTATASYTVQNRASFHINTTTKGVGSTITRDMGLWMEAVDQGTNNAFIADNNAFTGNYFINSTSTRESLFSGQVTAPRFVVTGSTVPANGIYLPSANTLGFAANTTLYGSISSVGLWTIGASGGGQIHVVNGDLAIAAQGILRLQDTTGGEYCGIRANGTTTTYVLVMPNATPSTNNILRAGSSTATDLVWTDGLATSTSNGFVNYYQTESISAVSGSFTSGTLKITRVGNVVTIASSVVLGFGSASAVSSASGLIPSYARPVADVNQFTFMNGSRLESVGVSTAGLLDWRAFDWAGSGAARTVAAAFCLSYSV